MMFKALRVRMLEKEILQGDVARLAGMAESTMTSRMQGRQPFTTWEIAAIAQVLDIRPEDWHRYFYERSPGQRESRPRCSEHPERQRLKQNEPRFSL